MITLKIKNMKRAKYFLYGLLLGVFLLFSFSCGKEKVEKPVINSFELATSSPIVLGVDNIVEVDFRFSFDADVGAIWSGDSASNYEAYQQQIANPSSDESYVKKDKGLGLSSSDTTYTLRYKKAGTFTAYLIATNVFNLGEDIERASASVEVVVLPAGK
jgi:hypothetical protein